MLIYQGINLGHERFVSHLTRYCTWFGGRRQPELPAQATVPHCAGARRPPAGMRKSPLEIQGALRCALARPYHLAGTVTGARAAPAGSFMNWKKLELGSTTSTSPGFENEAR